MTNSLKISGLLSAISIFSCAEGKLDYKTADEYILAILPQRELGRGRL